MPEAATMKLKLSKFWSGVASAFSGLRGNRPKSLDGPLILVFIPSLVAILRNRELKKGAPLTEEEVIAIRDKSNCVAMTPAMLRDIAERRGYDDIDPKDVWNEWQVARAEFLAP
jgi:hypothetical protein